MKGEPEELRGNSHKISSLNICYVSIIRKYRLVLLRYYFQVYYLYGFQTKQTQNIDIFIDARMGVNIMMCDVMRSELVLFSSLSVALAGVLLPTGGPHTSHITVHCHDITITLLSPLPI